MKLYVTEMQRWGEAETHHYVIGVFNTIESAQAAGKIEREYRGGKYEPAVSSFNLNESSREKILGDQNE